MNKEKLDANIENHVRPELTLEAIALPAGKINIYHSICRIFKLKINACSDRKRYKQCFGSSKRVFSTND
jgi:hypothetical protein